jgi:hypothetical protein
MELGSPMDPTCGVALDPVALPWAQLVVPAPIRFAAFLAGELEPRAVPPVVGFGWSSVGIAAARIASDSEHFDPTVTRE